MAATAKKQGGRPVIQWILVVFLLVIIVFGLFIAKDRPSFDPGPMILGAMALLGLIVRAIFKVPEGEEDDGYGGR